MIGVEWNWASCAGLLNVPGQEFWYSGPSKSTSVPRHPPICIFSESAAVKHGRSSPSEPAGSLTFEPAQVKFALPDVYHTFRPGHRIMVQVQSSWFPLVDRNPQTFVDIYTAKESDFRKATQRVYRSPERPSRVTVLVLPAPGAAEPASNSSR